MRCFLFVLMCFRQIFERFWIFRIFIFQEIQVIFTVLHFVGNPVVLWKRLTTETLQQNQTQKNGNLLNMNFFEAFPVFSKIIGNPSNLILRGISCFFYPFPQFLGQIPVYTGLIFLSDFSIFLRDFPIFYISFLIFWGHFWFSKKFYILSLLICFLLILLYFGLFLKRVNSPLNTTGYQGSVQPEL